MFRVKQAVKMLLQNVFLPFIYCLYCRRPIERGLVLFADAHHSEMPFSMRRMYETVEGMVTAKSDNRRSQEQNVPYSRGVNCNSPEGNVESLVVSGKESDGGSGKRKSDGERARETAGETALQIENFVTDFDALSFLALARYLIRFMRRYAVAEYVFICDYFLPVASCKKRSQTKVVQLWHSCGLMKQIAYDTGEDIPKGYHGSMFDNYSYLALSSEACVPVLERELRLPREEIF
ncbi:MAG: hypothetical protein LUF30_07780, partial [Lachnospiraceae bacterium]|nr:hypothetical protein [Lachnospiraceae bacterium]